MGGIVLEQRNDRQRRRSTASSAYERERRTRATDRGYTRNSYSDSSYRYGGDRYDSNRRVYPDDEVPRPGPRPRTSHRRRKKKKPILPLLILLAALVMMIYGVVKSMGGTEPGAPVDPLIDHSVIETEDDDGVPTPLMRRSRVYNIMLAATDLAGVRTDTMMVLSYDVPRQKVGVVSVPRDTLVPRKPGKNPRLVYGPGGVEQRQEDISTMLGVPIDYYVKVDIRGFMALVDELGGIDFYVPCDMEYSDPYQGLNISFKEGLHHLNGQQAMEVARFRKNNDGSGYSDVGRTQTQQKLLLALLDKVISWGSITKINNFVEIFNQYVETDLKLQNMLFFAAQARDLNTTDDVRMATLEGRGDGIYNGYKYCYVLDEEKTLKTVNDLINPFDRDLLPGEISLARPDGYMN